MRFCETEKRNEIQIHVTIDCNENIDKHASFRFLTH